MQVTLRLKNYSMEAVARLEGCVLTMKEEVTARQIVGGFYFDSDRSPMLFLAALEEEGFHFDDFYSITFEH